MRPAAPGLDAVLGGAFTVSYTARALREWNQESIADITLIDPRFSFDATRQVCGSGAATLAFADAWGRSYEPKAITDLLSPYGNWLEVTCHIRSGSFHSATVLGKFQIGTPRTGTRGTAPVARVRRTLAETIAVQLDDAFLGTKSEPVDGVQQSTVGRQMHEELADLLGLPVALDVPTRVGAMIEYPEDRLAAAFDLVQLVGGVPYMRWDGRVGIRPNIWPSPSFTVHDCAHSGAPGVPITSAQVDEWDSADVPNRIVVIAEAKDQTTLRAEKAITEGPMRYGPRASGAWGRRTRTYKVDSFSEQAQVDAYRDERFAADTAPRAVGVTLEMPLDPRLEPGDVGQLWSETVSGRIRIKKVDLSSAATMKVSAYLG